MSFVRRIRIALRGGVSLRGAVLETGRRGQAALARRRERAMLEAGRIGASGANASAREPSFRLTEEFARMSGAQLLEHFRTRNAPRFLPGFEETAEAQARVRRELFPKETERLISDASEIARAHRWPLLGYGVRDFGARIDWLRDPVSGARWPLLYHAQIKIIRGDGSDLRVLWELNRLSHLITLGRAYALTGEGHLAEEFFSQVESWREQNPVGYGANWMCAMEVALRAMNLLAAFRLFRRAPELTEARLRVLLSTFEEHGAHIRRNLEFSYLATGNHYLSDVTGLLWLGISLPELRAAREWRDFGWRELLREMDKQILPDGADCEASTGYHRLVLELYLYSFILCRANRIEIPERHLLALRAMLRFMRAYLRPDGRAPLVGDTDSGQVLPVRRRAADDHAYLLAIGAYFLDEAGLVVEDAPPEELLWLAGTQGVEAFLKLRGAHSAASKSSKAAKRPDATNQSEAFVDVGLYVMRDGDMYLLFNATGAGLAGRGSHGHNDALSVEVAACGVSFLSDAGTYVYTSNLAERQLFRSTAYHSTVEVDGIEQNTTDEGAPFVIGNEAQPRVTSWETNRERDFILAEHDGYRRLPHPVTHARAVTFEKRDRYWLVADRLAGHPAEHTFRFRFHAAPTCEVRLRPDAIVEVCDKMTGARLLILALDTREAATLEPRFSSRDYGEKSASVSACWTLRAAAPISVRWALVPIRAGEDETARLALIK